MLQKNDNEIAIEAMNEVLGGSFTARVNMNLREDKHWTYRAGSLIAPRLLNRKMRRESAIGCSRDLSRMVRFYGAEPCGRLSASRAWLG
jgi:predicted Zn-dependent peptidase